MKLNEWIIKNFKRNKAVIIYLAHEDGHYTSHWCIPENDNVVLITNTGNATVIDRDSMMLSTKWNVPTFIVHYENCEVINLKTISAMKESVYSSDELQLIVNNNELDKAFKASTKNKMSSETMMLLVIIALGFAGSIYFNNMKFQDLSKQLEPEPVAIVEVIEGE